MWHWLSFKRNQTPVLGSDNVAMHWTMVKNALYVVKIWLSLSTMPIEELSDCTGVLLLMLCKYVMFVLLPSMNQRCFELFECQKPQLSILALRSCLRLVCWCGGVKLQTSFLFKTSLLQINRLKSGTISLQ